MPVLFIYLLKLSISLAVVYLFYRFVLRRLTFYNWNRWYLVGYTLLCFFIAFIDIGPVLEKNDWNSSGIIEWVPVIETGSPAQSTVPVAKTVATHVDPWQLITGILIGGILLLFVRFLVQLFSFRRIARKATLISKNGAQIFQVDEKIIPFSFGNAIFINRHLHNEAELKEIIRHEFVHVKQKHTIDIIWVELLCLFNWYNPFAWLLRSAIRQNLEFIADNKVLKNGIDKKQYQILLLKVIGNNQFSIAPSFNFSSLKKRIAMMNKLKSARLNLVRFLFVLPFVAVMLLAFRNKRTTTGSDHNFWITGLVIDANSQMPLKGVEIREEISGRSIVSDQQGYFKLDLQIKDGYAKPSASFTLAGYERSIRRLSATNPGIEFVYLHRAGEKGPAGYTMAYPGEPQYTDVMEKFSTLQQQKSTQKKIDEMVGNSTGPICILNGVPYAIFDDGKGGKGSAWLDPKDLKDPYDFRVLVDDKIMTMEEANRKVKRSDLVGVGTISKGIAIDEYKVDYNLLYLQTPAYKPPCYSCDTLPVTNKSKLHQIATEYEINDKEAIMKLKDGTVEKYDLTDAKQKEAFEKKYGKIISIKGIKNINTNINTNTNITGTIAVDGEIMVTPVTVTGVGLGTGSGKGIGTGTATTVAPVTVVSGTGLTAIAPITVSGVNIATNTIAPISIVGTGSGTTVIAPLNPVIAGEGISIIDEDDLVVPGKEEVLVTITNRTTRLQLDEFKKQLKEKGLELNFDDVEYNSKGIITNLSGTLESKDGRSNFVALDFEKVILSLVTNGTRVSFKIRVKNREVI